MKKFKKILVVVLISAGVIFAAGFFIKSNKKSNLHFETETPYTATIEDKTVATGKVIPEDEVIIVPQISGIIDRIYVEEGDIVKEGDLIATIKVVPNEAILSSTEGRVKDAKIVLNNAHLEFERSKTLYEKKLISDQAFTTAELNLSRAQQNFENAKNDLTIIKVGTAGSGTANTNIRATVSGTILEIPVEKGVQVIEANEFNAGTTVATIADLTKMIFEGKVDEADVNRLEFGMPLKISLAAIKDKEFNATLRFVAPKGTEVNGAVQFTVKADVQQQEDSYVRAGYSANATMVLDRKENVLAIKEILLQFDKETDAPYVEVETGAQTFERRDVVLGISNGIEAEIISGLKMEDKIKVWNKTEPFKKQ
jgi:HlyD family secretion protein